MTRVDRESLPYRPNVGILLFNRRGEVLVARRADRQRLPDPRYGWQLPQGGIDRNEAPEQAVFREMREEIGTANAEILGRHPDLMRYDLPDAALGRALGGRYRGQEQSWFALRFLGADDEIRLDLDPHPEFDAWRWVALAELAELAVPFKRDTYAALARHFAHLAEPAAGDAAV